MKLSSYIRKAKNLIKMNYFNQQNFILPNLYLQNTNLAALKQVRSVLFYFANNEYMHLGDHLFFIPLIQVFIKSGFNVTVAPTGSMQPLFEKLKFPIFDKSCRVSNYDLVISRVEMLDEVVSHKALLVNVSKNLTQPICDQLLTSFGKFFSLKAYEKIDYTKLALEKNILYQLGLPEDKKIVVFNLFCDASAFMVTQAKKNYLLKLACEYSKKSNYILVLVGTLQDSYSEKIDFPYVDLRGKTSVLEIFSLVKCDNVECYIGFDAFVMHVFSLLNKPSFVVFRGRLFKQQHEMLLKYHTKLFNNDNYVTLLDPK